MLNLIVANADPPCGKPKNRNKFSKPNFRTGAEPDPVWLALWFVMAHGLIQNLFTLSKRQE
jgi:hypothetical protein